jgi:hypothetical protein
MLMTMCVGSACRTPALYKAWRQLGFQEVLRRPATVEGLMYPNSVRMTLWMLLGCLPWLLLRWLRNALQLVGSWRRSRL